MGSPQPYVPSPPRSSPLFVPEDEPAPLRAESLVEFVREFNRGHTGSKLVIWTRTQAMRDALKAGSPLTSPAVLRFVIPDVLMVYVSLVFETAESPVVVESAAAFGPRERVRVDAGPITDSDGEQKLPHEQSDFQVFQGLSQHLARMLVSHPRVPVQVVMVSVYWLRVASLMLYRMYWCHIGVCSWSGAAGASGSLRRDTFPQLGGCLLSVVWRRGTMCVRWRIETPRASLSNLPIFVEI